MFTINNRVHPTLARAVVPGTGRILDFGCGYGLNRRFIESRGYTYTGMDNDLNKKNLSVWGDCLCAPFKNETFNMVVSTAVFEHLSDPAVAAKEAKRVLKTGGIFAGSVAFLEPFHSNSHFHMSRLGVVKVLSEAGLEVERVWSGGNVLEAQLRNLFPWKGLNTAVGFLGRMLWWMHLLLFCIRDAIKRQKAYADMQSHQLAYASAIGFIARKRNAQ